MSNAAERGARNRVRADEAKLLAPMFETRKAKIWVMRAPGISEFDPVELALGSLQEASMHNRLPAGHEIQTIDGIVLIAPSSDTPGFSDHSIESVIADARRAGRTIPLLAVACDPPQAAQQPDGISWRTSVPLSALAAFVESTEKDQRPKAAA